MSVEVDRTVLEVIKPTNMSTTSEFENMHLNNVGLEEKILNVVNPQKPKKKKKKKKKKTGWLIMVILLIHLLRKSMCYQLSRSVISNQVYCISQCV